MQKIFFAALGMYSASLMAAPDNTQLSVWVNEAIVATYTFDSRNFLQRQKEIARYFSSSGWAAYSTALNASKLPETVKTNQYVVSAVATMPPVVKALSDNMWQADMPVLVIYKNPQTMQKQTLTVTVNFSQASAGQGVRGFAINNLQSKVSEPPCECQPLNTSS